MTTKTNNALVVLGPTASGKTSLGARLADLLGGEILSADSRQVYRGLDIGSGKDLDEYVVEGRQIPYHLIDITDVDAEFSVFHYQQAFYHAFEAVCRRKRLPVIVGGSGMYLDAVLCGYRMVAAPENPGLRACLAAQDDAALQAHLRSITTHQHNTTDLTDRTRLIRAIEIAEYSREHPAPPSPEVRALILGILLPPKEQRQRIAKRLQTRLDEGLVDEVAALHEKGCSWERLELLGLEYRFVARYLQGTIKNRNDLTQKLCGAIAQFAKRQRTWFRRMERQGHTIHWLPSADLAAALRVIQSESVPHPNNR